MVAVEHTKKRKNSATNTSAGTGGKSSKRKVATTTTTTTSPAVSKERVEELEDQISQSRKHYNNIAALLLLLGVNGEDDDDNKEHAHRKRRKATCELVVGVSLCRVFCRLLAAGQLNRDNTASRSEQEQLVVEWLRGKLQEYQDALLVVLRRGLEAQQSAVLTLCMRLVKEQAAHMAGSETQVWSTGLFHEVVVALVQAEDGEEVRAEFMRKFAAQYHDVAVYLVMRIANYLSTERPSHEIDSVIAMLTDLGGPPAQDATFDSFYAATSKPNSKKKTTGPFTSPLSFKKKVQDAWLGVLRHPHDTPRRKALLRIMSRNIAPYFVKPELLMDFLTDTYNHNEGGLPLLALSGLFYLIQARNLDYPHFYTKLYSLLDAGLLHSKHRSRSLRLFATFLASTHLPAALVASFIKRLARLALFAPPAAVVVVVPFVYNLLVAHPACTFLLHREIPTTTTSSNPHAHSPDHAFPDPFDPSEPDPSLTHALDSSLWELHSLHAHYHPNVAAIARILSEQFTKSSYNLEDFLDHSYQGLLEAELGRGGGGGEEKPFRKTPVVEFQIPKRIFTDRLLREEDGGGGVDTESNAAIRELWEFS